MKATILLIILIVSLRLFSQERFQPNKIIPPSPTSASLGAYGEIPVGYYSGTANISIPLCDIKTSGHTLPISLNYNSSGVKVNQDASWVGLGWSLFAGGVITRTIRGLDDFAYQGYNSAGALPPSNVENEFDFDPNNSDNSAYSDYLNHVVKKEIDPEPDMFFYNFGSFSGKFVIGKQSDGSPVLTAQRNNLQMQFDPNYATNQYPTLQSGQWIITDPNGYKYYFRSVELSEDYYNNGDVSSQNLHGLEPVFTRSYNESITAWYLDLIVAPSGEELSLEYEYGYSLSTISRNVTQYDLTYPTYSSANAPPLSSKYTYYNTSRQVIKNVYLKRINFTGGHVEFNRTSRLDIEPHPLYSPSPQKLSEIIVFNSNNEQIKKFTFQHSYFDDGLPSAYDYHYKRLKLDAVVESGKTGSASKPPYVFSYYAFDQLPSKYSTQVDLWGYYSNFYSPTINSEYYPTMLPEVQTDTWTGSVTFAGTSREPDKTGNLIKRGMLTTIQYPTGGKTEFDYEANSYVVPPYTVPGSQDQLAYAVSNYINSSESNLVSNFSLYGTTTVSLSLIATPQWDNAIQSTDVVAYLKDAATNAVVESFSLSQANKTISLPAGQYSLVVNEIVDYFISLEAYYQNAPVTLTTKVGGGLRIKTIINYDYNNKKTSIKKFQYQGGLLISKPVTHYYTHVVLAGDIEDITNGQWAVSEGDFLVRESNSVFPLGFNSDGNIVGQYVVSEISGENGEGGKIDYQYFVEETPVDQNSLPGVPVLPNTRNGQLLDKTIWDKNGQKVSETTYGYELKESYSIKGLKIFKPVPEYSAPGTAEYFDRYYGHYYDNSSDWWVQSSETEDNYLNGVDVSTTKTNHYDNSIHKQITSNQTIRSDGTVITTTYKYPQDFISQSPYDAMVANHIIAPVVEQTTLKGVSPSLTTLEATKTNFYNWNGIFAPQTIESKQGSGDYKTRLRFYGYDEKGNLLSVSKENDAPSTYIWGYNKTYPIIKADNVTNAQLGYAVSNALYSIGVVGIENIDQFLTNIGSLTFSSQKTTLKSFITALQQQLASYKTTFSVYTYESLIGMTSVTDSNNKTTYFEYDEFGRNTIVRDNDGNIIKSYKYNYRQ